MQQILTKEEWILPDLWFDKWNKSPCMKWVVPENWTFSITSMLHPTQSKSKLTTHELDNEWRPISHTSQQHPTTQQCKSAHVIIDFDALVHVTPQRFALRYSRCVSRVQCLQRELRSRCAKHNHPITIYHKDANENGSNTHG